jgi:hypothetical protein
MNDQPLPAPGSRREEGDEASTPAVEAVEGGASEIAGANPLKEQLDFSLSVPQIEVRMVNAAVLEEYEIWVLASSLLSSASVGFIVAYLQSFETNSAGAQQSDATYLVVAIIFVVLLAISGTRAIRLRRRIASESRTYAMKASASTPQ